MSWQRHELVWLTPCGWHALLAAAGRDGTAPAECLHHWANDDLPLVVTRQPAQAADTLAVALASPLRWGRQRLALRVPWDAVARRGRFPSADAVTPLLDIAIAPAWRRLCGGLTELGVAPLVYGSLGWELLCGLRCRRAGSDIDLLLPVRSTRQADAAAALLLAAALDAPRLDGELVWPDGSAAAWREWAAWRSGRVAQLLVKRLRSVALECGTGWAEAA